MILFESQNGGAEYSVDVGKTEELVEKVIDGAAAFETAEGFLGLGKAESVIEAVVQVFEAGQAFA